MSDLSTSGAANPEQTKTVVPVKLTAYRWYVILLLAVLYVNYNVDRNLVAILVEPLRAEFALSDSQLGLLTGLSFAISFAIAGIPLGLLIDRVNRVKLYTTLMVIWSVATVLCGFAKSYAILLATRVVVGGAESGAAPASMSILSDYFPKEKRGGAIGLFYLGTPIGLAVAYAGGGFLADQVGWRMTFIIAGAPGFLLALLTWFTLREPKRGAMDEPGKNAQLVSSFSTVIAVMKAKKSLIILFFAAVTCIAGISGLTAFKASLYVRYFDVSLTEAGIFLGLILGLAGAIGTPLGGYVADIVSKRSLSYAPIVAGVFVLISAPFAMAAIFASSVEVSVALFFVYSVLTSATYLGPTLSTFLTLSPPRLRGAMSALIIVGMNMFGFGVGPQFTGVASDMLNNAGVHEPLRVAMFMVSFFLVLSGILYLWASRTTNADAALEVDDSGNAIRPGTRVMAAART
ncbi:MAG: MFS transporter [Sphingomonadales bacterium]